MDSADPRTQPASQPPQQQPHHHPQQHHTQPQQRQPQQPPNDQQQQPHHIQQQLTQPQSLHQQQQTTHPPQHAQQNQQTGYVPQQHTYAHQLQLGHYHSQPAFPRHQYPPGAYGPNQIPYYHTFVPPAYNQHAWPQQPPFTAAGPVPTPPAQGLTIAPKTTPTTLPVREKRVLTFIDPKTSKPVDLTDLEKSQKSTQEKATNSTKTTTTAPTKPTSTQQTKSVAKAATTIATPNTTTTATTTTTTTTKNSAVPVNATITNNNVTDSSSSDRTGTSSPPSVSNILLQKVSEDTSSDQRKEAASTVPTTSVVTSKAPLSTPAAKTTTTTTTEPSATPAPATVTEVSSDPRDVKKEVEDKKEEVQEKKEVEVTEQKSVVNNVEQTEKVDKIVTDDKQTEACDDDSMKNDDDVNGEINLHYEKGQYNPTLNRNGKKKYSREFMLEVCEKICKFDINSEVCSDSGMTAYNLEKTDSFLPNFHQPPQAKFQSANRQNDPSRRQNPNNYTGRSSAGQERQRKIIVPSSSLTNEVELKTVSNPWRPGAKEVKEDVPDDVVQVESLKKKFRSILNKLTPQNFDNLAAAVTDLNIDTEAKLGEVIDIVFAKALAEPGYCVLYGQMCSHLKKITAGAANFGNTLLKRCQNQFQADIYSGLNIEERKKKIEEEQDPEVKKQLDEELYEDMFRCRMRGLGLIKFIGELYKIEMLIDTIMFDCITRLLADPSSEESLECLCDLLKTIGEKLDRSSQAASKDKQRGSKNTPKANAYHGKQSLASVLASGPQKPPVIATLDPIFDQLHKIRNNKDLPLSVRIRFKLLDVCELREKENWQSKSKDNNPKKLDEIKKDHMESERQKSMGPRKSQEGRRGLGQGGGSSSSLVNDSGSNRNNFHSSASSQSIRDHSYGDKTLQSNIDQHKMQEQHQINTSAIGALLKNMALDRKDSSGGLGRPQFSILRPVTQPHPSKNATATSDTTKSAAATNLTNANAAGGGGQ